jgi:hypothetical protein
METLKNRLFPTAKGFASLLFACRHCSLLVLISVKRSGGEGEGKEKWGEGEHEWRRVKGENTSFPWPAQGVACAGHPVGAQQGC